MIFRHSIQIFCWMLIVNSSVKYVRAISFDDILEYFFEIDDSDEFSDELTNTNLNVTCKNCTLSVECHNCTHGPKDTQSTIPMKTLNNPQIISSSPTPTIPAPEIVSSNNAPSQHTATASQSSVTASQTSSTAPKSTPTVNTVPVPNAPTTNTNPVATPAQTPSTKSTDDSNQVTDDGLNNTTDLESSSSAGVTGVDAVTTN